MDSIFRLITAFIVFAFVLFITVYTTRWVADYAKKQQYNKNIEVIETFKLTPNKHVAIVRTGGRYLVLGIGKDEIHPLAELSKEEIDLSGDPGSGTPDFGKLIEKAGLRIRKKDDDSGGAA